MSVTDELSQLEEHVKTRMRELKPLVEEYTELEAVAKRLGLPVLEQTSGPRATRGRSRDSAGKAAKQRRSRSGAASAPASRRGSGGQRREQVLATVRERPGITVREVAEQLGVDPTSLYRVVHGLVADGLVRKNGRGLQPARSAGGTDTGADAATTAAPATEAAAAPTGATGENKDAQSES